MVIMVGTREQVEAAVGAAEPFRERLQAAGVLLVPAAIYDQGSGTSDGAAPQASAADLKCAPAEGDAVGVDSCWVFGLGSAAGWWRCPHAGTAPEPPCSASSIRPSPAPGPRRNPPLHPSLCNPTPCPRWVAQPVRLAEWRTWFEQQTKSQGTPTAGGLYISLRLDGRIRASGRGSPPWEQLAAQLPSVSGFFGGFLDGMDGRV